MDFFMIVLMLLNGHQLAVVSELAAGISTVRRGLKFSGYK
jgi:hypothetical protein